METKKTLLLAFVLTAAAGNLWAQTVQPQANAGTTAAAQPPLIVQLTPGLVGETNTPGWFSPSVSDFGNRLRDDGVVLHARVFDEAAANPLGGVRQSSTNVLSQAFGADFSLQRIIGLPGGYLHILINHEAGDSLSQRDIGDGIIAQARWKGYHGARLAILTYEQQLLNGRLDILGGRTFPLADFATNNFGDDFMASATLGSEMSGTIQNANLAAFPLSTWGGRVKFKATPDVYVQAGGYEADAGNIALASGFNWGTHSAIGQTYIAEIGYGQEYGQTAYPMHMKLGGWYDNFRHTDLYANVNGQSITLDGGQPLIDGPNGGVYIQADKVVYRPDIKTKRNLEVFTSFYSTTDQTNQYHSQFSLGFVYTGLFPRRPKDVLGFAGDWYTLGSQYVAFLTAAREKVGGTGETFRNMGTFELNYGIHLADGVQFWPDLQYVINPDTFYQPLTKKRPNNALIIGAFLTINLGDVFGFPSHF